MKRAAILLVIIALLAVFIQGCAAPTAEIKDSEKETVAEKMRVRELEAEPMRFDVVYDVKDVPRYILCVSPKGYVMYDRTKDLVAETSTGDPFADYPDAKKYFTNIATYVVYDEASPEAPYMNIYTGLHGASPEDVPNWKWTED